MFRDTLDLLDKAKKNLVDARAFEFDDQPKTVPYRMETFSFSKEYRTELPYNELITSGLRAPTLRQDRFVIDKSSNRKLIEIPELTSDFPGSFKFLHDNMDECRFFQQVASIQNDFLPISYRKLHINALYKTKKHPGDDNTFIYRMDVQPIDFFFHQIVRSYLRGNKKYGGQPSSKEEADYQKTKWLYDTSISFNAADVIMSNNRAFYLMAGCGIWVLSADGFIMVSLRKRVQEKPNCLGYSAAGSCEYTKRLDKTNPSSEELEADPFQTIRRELEEECNIEVDADDLEMVSFGIDYERYLQQFSFFLHSKHTARDIIELSKEAPSRDEQELFALPFNTDLMIELIKSYEMEPGAIIAMRNIMRRYPYLLI